jgi:hypothetical protein
MTVVVLAMAWLAATATHSMRGSPDTAARARAALPAIQGRLSESALLRSFIGRQRWVVWARRLAVTGRV